MSLLPTALDRYIDGQSPIHRLDARVKLLLTLGYVLTLAFLPPGAWFAYGLCAALLWWVVRQAQVGLRTILTRALVALPFTLVAITLIFTRPGLPLWHVALGPWLLTASDVGVVAFVSVVLKSWLSVQATLLLTATTHVFDVLSALHVLRVPKVLVTILGFAYRYLFVMVDEAQRMLRARECRSATLPNQRSGGTLLWRAAVVGQMVGTLFLRSYERSERIYLAMLARGFNGELRTLSARPLARSEQGLLVLSGAGLAALVWVAYVV